ncbi:DUF1345 domain-containing protein [Paludibacterium paludis]|uniref:DUF1345 domain-containing protein n=1 Tax=Paludibacterium paludis TaxID=1225769 RepID=A0A918NYJ7_9NEIS|nr:DUF1345 domain-containing protein [Paludibacterium paludis]GGY07229.1 hypothetical protein GCM10011289_07310 [Paludibacterium paludis]
MTILTRLYRQIAIRPRLLASLCAGAAAGFVLPASIQNTSRLLIGWNTGTWLYLLLALHMVATSTHDSMKQRARQQDEGRNTVLALVIVAALASLAAIVAELAVAKDMRGVMRYGHIGLSALTVLTSWTFIHTMFALHYAHDFYMAGSRGRPAGLAFPGDDTPAYWDFLYFAFIIGTSGQTADVSFTTTSMRRIGLVHCVLAFLFNTTLLALTINIAAGLF